MFLTSLPHAGRRQHMGSTGYSSFLWSAFSVLRFYEGPPGVIPTVLLRWRKLFLSTLFV